MTHAQKQHSYEELVALEEASSVRHEYIGGIFYAMAGGTPTHAHLSVNLSTAIHSRLRGKPCRGASSDQRVKVKESDRNWYYPDFTIMCPPFHFHSTDKNALLNPRAIFEVLSPATEEFDRTGKFEEYKQIPELSDYFLVHSDRVFIEHFRRAEGDVWQYRAYFWRAEELKLENFGIGVPVAEIYEDTDLPEGPVPAPPQLLLDFNG